MHIEIRTYDEFSDDRVKLEVAPGQRAEIRIGGNATLDPGALGRLAGQEDRIKDLEATNDALQSRNFNLSEFRRVAEDRVAELERDLNRATTGAERAEARVKELEKAQASDGNAVGLWDKYRQVTAEMHRMRGEKAVLIDQLDAAQERAAKVSSKLIEIHQAVRGDKIDGVELLRAVTRVREVLDIPSADTSQA